MEGKLKGSNAENTALIAEKASLEREFKSSKSGHGVLEKEVSSDVDPPYSLQSKKILN